MYQMKTHKISGVRKLIVILTEGLYWLIMSFNQPKSLFIYHTKIANYFTISPHCANSRNLQGWRETVEQLEYWDREHRMTGFSTRNCLKELLKEIITLISLKLCTKIKILQTNLTNCLYNNKKTNN